MRAPGDLGETAAEPAWAGARARPRARWEEVFREDVGVAGGCSRIAGLPRRLFLAARGCAEPRLPRMGRVSPRRGGVRLTETGRWSRKPPQSRPERKPTDTMARSSQARKRVRQNPRRAARNRACAGRARTCINEVETAVAGGGKEGARAALGNAEPEMARGAQKGRFHRNTMQRKLSRLSSKIKCLSA